MRVIYREPLTRVDFNFLLLRRGCAQSDEIIEAGNLFFNFHSGLIITEIYIYIENRIACHWRDLFENSWTVSKRGDAERSVVSWAVSSTIEPEIILSRVSPTATNGRCNGWIARGGTRFGYIIPRLSNNAYGAFPNLSPATWPRY